MEKMKFDERITIGAQPTAEDLRQLARQGVKTVVNLRQAGEQNQPLSPEEEGRKARELGLDYIHIPVSPQGIKPEQVDAFRQKLGQSSGPVYVHCFMGKRAGAFAIMEEAVNSGKSGEEALQEAGKKGLNYEPPGMGEFVKDYIDQRRK